MQRASLRTMRLVGFIAAVLCGTATVRSVEPPRWETFSGKDRSQAYSAAAKDFITENADSPQAAEVLLEALALAMQAKESGQETHLKARLLFEHPATCEAAVALATFKDGESYGEFLKSRLDDASSLDDPRQAEQLCAAVRLGLKRWNEELFKNQSLLLRTALLSHVSDDGELRRMCFGQLAKKDVKQEIRDVADALFNNPVGRATIVAALDDLQDNPYTEWCRLYLLMQLTADEFDDTRIVEIAAREFLLDYRWEAALSHVARLLADENRPQWQYWQVLCLAALGRTAEADRALREFNADPNDPWKALASHVAEGHANVAARLQRDATAIAAGMQALAANREMFEGWVDFGLPGGAITVYFGGDLPRQEFHLAALVGEEVKIAQRSLGEESWYFETGAREIDHFTTRGMLPYITLHIGQSWDGIVHTNYGFGVNSKQTYAEMGQMLDTLFASSRLATEDCVVKLLTRAAQRGSFPALSKADKNGFPISWKSPGFTKSEMEVTSLQFDPQGRLTGIADESVKLRQMRTGRSGSFALQPPRWPNRPQREAGSNNLDLLSRVMRKLGEIGADSAPNPK